MMSRQMRRARALGLVAASLTLAAAGPVLASPNGSADAQTTTPIKHVIVVIGENRSFDHLFATYVSPSGDPVRNLLSEGVIGPDGKPGPNFTAAVQQTASDTTTYSISPTIVGTYTLLPPPNVGFAPSQASIFSPPFTKKRIAARYDYGLLRDDLVVLTTGATGLPVATIDTRITRANRLPSGPFSLSPGVTSDDYANSPTHRFYQMYQQLDCAVAYATAANPSGCRADLFPWVEVSVGPGYNGGPQPPHFTDETTDEGATAMGFYNIAAGDDAYLKELADQYTLLDNYHQPALGGTTVNSLYLGFADAIAYSDGQGHPATPPSNQIENPDPQPGTNDWYTQDGYFGGSYSNCSDPGQPGVSSVLGWLSALAVPPNCAAGQFYMLNNLSPGYLGDGALANLQAHPFTLPPSATPSIGDVMIAKRISWAYYGENFNAYLADPGRTAPGSEYCDSCNPFQYETAFMTGTDPVTGQPYRLAHLKDTTDFYDAVRTGRLPAVSFVKPSGLNDGHPQSSKMSIYEAFLRKIIKEVQANGKLASNTAIFVTVDEGGGYYDSGYVQPLDFFGDGTRIPMIIVSPYTTGGHVSHVYGDHASVVKFIEANWGLPPISARSRDNLPNPVNGADPYVPTNRPALSDLMAAFHF